MKDERVRSAEKEARAALLAGMSDADVAAKFHGRSGTAIDVLRSGMFSPIGVEPKVVGALLAAPTGTWNSALEGTRGVFLCNVEEHKRPSEEEFNQFSRVDEIAVAKKDDGSGNYLVAMVGKEVYGYKIHKIHADGLLDKTLTVKPAP